MSEWIDTSDRLPTKADANECACVWAFNGEEVEAVHYFHVSPQLHVSWLPREPVAAPDKP